MLKEVASFAVIATVGYLDLLTVHVVLNLMVPHSLPIPLVPISSLFRAKKNTSRTRKCDADTSREFKDPLVNLSIEPNGANRVKQTNAT